MSRVGSSRCSVLTAALALIAGATWPTVSATAGPIISISNRTKNAERFTDLTAIKKNAAGNVVNKNVIIPPGNPNVTGVLLQPNQAKLYDAGFKPTDIIVSTAVNKVEMETKLFKVLQLSSKEIGWLSDPTGTKPIYLAIDYTQYNFNFPTADSLLAFTNGTNSSLPGWFAGTNIDLSTGDITSPYTGSALVQDVFFNVASVPEPSAWILMSIGVLGLIAYSFHRQSRHGIA